MKQIERCFTRFTGVHLCQLDQIPYCKIFGSLGAFHRQVMTGGVWKERLKTSEEGYKHDVLSWSSDLAKLKI